MECSFIPCKMQMQVCADGERENGEPCWVRTSDLLIKSQLLYRLS